MVKDKLKKQYTKLDKKSIEQLIIILKNYYSDAKCSLDFNSPFELVCALILAAQCTDERVNKVIPVLFNKFADVYEIANASIEEIANIVKPCGFYNNKAISISESAKTVVNVFNGKVPDTMEDLCKLKGIGRKSANIILQECFNNTVGIAVDTHVTRLSRKMGISNAPTQEKIEKELMSKVDKKYWNKINHIFVYHGRAICIARKPNCNDCPINKICAKNE